MKRHLSRLLGAGLLVLGLVGEAFAHGHGHGHHLSSFHVPELDPTLIASGLTFVGGAALLLVERYRRR